MLTTAQKNKIAQDLTRDLLQHFNISMYVATRLGHMESISLDEGIDIAHRIETIIGKAQIPPELLTSKVPHYGEGD